MLVLARSFCDGTDHNGSFTFETVLTFTGIGGTAPGSYPTDLHLGRDGKVYGTTSAGGVGGGGVVFRLTLP